MCVAVGGDGIVAVGSGVIWLFWPERLFWLSVRKQLLDCRSKTSQAGVDWLALVWLSSVRVDSWTSLELR